jgi:signal recognition particle GTPase
MNTIIGLRGKGGTGKTTTIGKLFEILKKKRL